MNPRFTPFRVPFFYGFIALVFFLLVMCQPIAAAEILNSPTDQPVAFMTGSLVSLLSIVSFGIFLMIMTAFFSLVIGSIKERKNQFIILGILFVLVLFKDLFPLFSTGMNFEGLAGFITSLFHIIGMYKYPLVIILAGMLWFWPENKIRWPDSACCSALVFTMGMVIWGLLALTGSLPRLFECIDGISHSAPGNTEVQVFIHFFISLITLILTLILSWIGFRIIAKYREKNEKPE